MNDCFRFVRTYVVGAALALTVTVAPAAAAGVMYLDFAATGTQGEVPTQSLQQPPSSWIQISGSR